MDIATGIAVKSWSPLVVYTDLCTRNGEQLVLSLRYLKLAMVMSNVGILGTDLPRLTLGFSYVEYLREDRSDRRAGGSPARFTSRLTTHMSVPPMNVFVS